MYAERDGEGYRLLVAIADVSHYVRPGTALDTEARARGTSVYFPTRVLPMLPTALSNHLCSLEPQVDRLCMAADMSVSARGALRSWRVYPAVMRSAARLTYDMAHTLLFTREPAARAALGALAARLDPLVEVYQVLLRARAQRGALDFDAPEAKFVLSREEQVRAIEFRSRNDAHKLIEECMVLANVAAAREMRRLHVPGLHRVHPPPEQRKLDALKGTLQVLGIDLQLPAQVRDARPGGNRAAGARPRAAAAGRVAGGAIAGAGRLPARATSATSGWRCPITRTSPRRSAATRTCSCTARCVPGWRWRRASRFPTRARSRRPAPNCRGWRSGPTRRIATSRPSSSASTCAIASASPSTAWSRRWWNSDASSSCSAWARMGCCT